MVSPTDAIAQMFMEAQSKADCEEIFKERCLDYGDTAIRTIANKLRKILAGMIAPDLTSELASNTRSGESTTVHHGEYLLWMRYRDQGSARKKKKKENQETSQSEGITLLPFDFMRLFDHVGSFKEWNWKAKTIAVRLYTGRRIGEVLYRSDFEWYSEYSVKITKLSKVGKEQRYSSATIPTLIPASEVLELIESLRDEWHNDGETLAKAWDTYQEDLDALGMIEAGEILKKKTQFKVCRFFDQHVKPAFPELSSGDDEEDDEEKNGHSLRGVYGCLFYRLMGGHTNPKISEKYMQKCLVHVDGETTQGYRSYNLINFESILKLHPGLSGMLFLKNVAWITYDDDLAAFNIQALVSQINDPMDQARLYEAIGLKKPTALGEFIGAILLSKLGESKCSEEESSIIEDSKGF